MGNSTQRRRRVTERHTDVASSRPLPLLLTLLSLLGAQIACAPLVDVAGVYFPGWLVSAIIGLTLAYVIVLVLGRAARTRELAQSGLFFVGLTVGIALTVRLACFSGF